jgi:hypothetical protein
VSLLIGEPLEFNRPLEFDRAGSWVLQFDRNNDMVKIIADALGIDLWLKATEKDKLHKRHCPSATWEAVEAIEGNNGQKLAVWVKSRRHNQFDQFINYSESWWETALLSKSKIQHGAVAQPGIACHLRSRCPYSKGRQPCNGRIKRGSPT